MVSDAARDRVEFVNTAYETRGARMLHTSTSGAVQVDISAGRLAVEVWRDASAR